ncbi:hypothetical protein CDAR_613701 [Caerostris darwini]|uniref:Uncharacterized protein n=1 Tax=Caerostris darwini TaxID=1538125 RepID=A0AAV4TME9_9ARAC|nr:hypothetical protein CDAR_613701 [Caerostris darwini]
MDFGRICNKNYPSIIPPVRVGGEACVHKKKCNKNSIIPLVRVGGLRAQPFNEFRDCAKKEGRERDLPFLKINIPRLIFSGNRGGNSPPSTLPAKKIQSPSPITYSTSLRNKWIQRLPGRALKRIPQPPFSYSLQSEEPSAFCPRDSGLSQVKSSFLLPERGRPLF